MRKANGTIVRNGVCVQEQALKVFLFSNKVFVNKSSKIVPGPGNYKNTE
jgi:hypothetical protein